MLAVKGYYQDGTITLLEPLPQDVKEAELNIVVLPKKPKRHVSVPSDRFRLKERCSEDEFQALGLSAFFDNEDDANVDWENFFGLK